MLILLKGLSLYFLIVNEAILFFFGLIFMGTDNLYFGSCGVIVKILLGLISATDSERCINS